MKRLRPVLLVLALTAFTLTGCAHEIRNDILVGENVPSNPFPADTFTTRVGSFIVLIDVSASMGELMEGMPKLEHVRNFLSRMNAVLPESPDIQFAVRTFGHNPLLTFSSTKLQKPFSLYRTAQFNDCLASLQSTGGQSPMAAAINEAMEDLKDAEGDIAMLILSDGEVHESADALRRLKKHYGYRVSIYPVLVGSSPSGIRRMKEFAWIGQTGFYTDAANIRTGNEMSEFVRRVFLERHLDTDGDRIIDIKDECPDTPAGAIVDSRGCWVLQGVEYEFAKWEIASDYYPTLDEVVNVLETNPDVKVEIHGHTDNVGSDHYNLNLSLWRAESVKKYLVENGIGHDRLHPIGYGASRPIASNDTEKGRALNRRVEFRPVRLQFVGQ